MSSDRVQRRARSDFGSAEADTVIELLAQLDRLTDENAERVQAAVILYAAGDSRRFVAALAIAEADWRDALVWGGLASADWREQLSGW